MYGKPVSSGLKAVSKEDEESGLSRVYLLNALLLVAKYPVIYMRNVCDIYVLYIA